MPRIPFRFFARVILLTGSAVLAILSVVSHVVMQEFALAAGSIAAAMLASMFRRKHRDAHPVRQAIASRGVTIKS
jgi:imidazole glycerol phosphate synthase subunit HisF